ncbi:helix-turn-helix domain-containing protein [Collinsella ureilytica]|nr:helix-turn-helix domain-containing protein [Collinsella urealyticum]
MKLRKAAGYSNRDDFAAKIGVNRYTYRSWESGAAMMNAEQVWNCAVALKCTPNDILGWYDAHPGEGEAALDRDETLLVADFRSCTPDRRRKAADAVRDQRDLSQESIFTTLSKVRKISE